MKNQLEAIDSKIQLMLKAGQELKEMAKDFPAVDRNVARILASIRMLEMNVSDIKDIC